MPSLSVVMSLSFSASAGQPLTWCFRRGLGERFIRELLGEKKETEIIFTGNKPVSYWLINLTAMFSE